jgi:excinuclease ABC subunit C
MLSTTGDTFVEFGPSKYLRRTVLRQFELPATYREVRSQIRAECPKSPGVYGMIDCVGRLVYVGMSRHLRDRTLTYFQSEKQIQISGEHRKEARVASRAKRLVWETSGHELLALLRERELIRRFGPEMNISGRRRLRLAYLVLTVEDAPRFTVASQLPKGCRHHWGPVVKSSFLIRVTDTLNRYFKLPDCSPDIRMRFRGEPNLFDMELEPRCLRGEIKSCLAPCSQAVSRSQYVAQLNRARAFLSGKSDAPINELDRSIQQAVVDRRFEHAARLHAIRTDLADLRERLLPRKDLLPSSFVYTFDRHGRTCWLACHESLVTAVAPAPRQPRSFELWRSRLERWRDAKLPIIDEREGGELEILSSWFRRHPDELALVTDFDSARIMCST